MRLLFLCTGNTCRSPMAEKLFREKVKDRQIDIQSAGVAAFDGQTASVHAERLLQEKGIDHQHAAQRLNGQLIAWADLILTMTRGHKGLVLELFPEAVTKTFTLKEYVGIEGDIADPFGGDYQMYQQCAEEIEESLDLLYGKLHELPSSQQDD